MAPTALLSVSNKEGLVPLAQGLLAAGYQLISSGGTAAALAAAGLPVTKVAEHTGAPEILGGRVKTLHPRIHGGILAKRSEPSHEADLQAQGIAPIDVVVVNLYPFRETIAAPDATWEVAIENIDIGGPAMVRAAAKNHADVAVLTDPGQYGAFLGALQAGAITGELRRRLALQAFRHTAEYDTAISTWLAGQLGESEATGAQRLSLDLVAKQTLRYGENPHQGATWFADPGAGLAGGVQLQGKELSYNNLIDLEAALATVREFGYGGAGAGSHLFQPAAVVVKHTNPCGVATGSGSADALQRALDADRVSAFGGIVAINGAVDGVTAAQLTSLFLECVVAPSFSPEAREALAAKANLRLLELPPEAIARASRQQLRSVLGGVLVQELDDQPVDESAWQVVSQRQPTAQELEDLRFAWRLVRHVRSNAITVAKGGQSLGIGAGQMNRVGSARLALEAAGERARGAVLASDGFFPFDDTVRLAADHGIGAVIQPGGSVRDAESIQACDELGLAMVVTGRRHFLH
ncbi:bifunctional phosphoribosylaminoimidazolecarboxamide formyltransferase/IMP cyclohydrolase [Vulcanococcus limneticus Candia 3F8]|uniref:bifunctional phosphoribosylaminoimidazolecarboxamide formyltransferase/IMP cyclohydrolase n=1 Tax=Vulcanococcus limneticus TaxID=2170428 RepID=UPI000B97D352|nr:bifunctional phosphoribosylaminoimidazolecarboxamide formyltransferase/IMP cyclohydrolase [Vulcanococcus limneticus]MCP9791727.1 bifunctional phosphoribosylaminoimidazolecarboxamide formyltransferase/IMP cyclohydrolase [Vulcanococcus limneticus MW73D5]MCP9893589.1 bifunctional phosphoribosylaminoimidazolecarboxamide formyltransferase/IMP cyclohydrolase [Vulcanococcus limneticus Candia 3F8]MCP9897122.1 bifunctional phosphoribosylaminoimidazolecarboxamide formyltransferase/IMP cyclohydrolase [V